MGDSVILFCRGAGSPGQHSDDLAGDRGALLHRRQENRHRRLHFCGTNLHVGHRGVRSHFQCHVSNTKQQNQHYWECIKGTVVNNSSHYCPILWIIILFNTSTHKQKDWFYRSPSCDAIC